MLSAIDRNHCPQSIGIPVRNRRNPHNGPIHVSKLTRAALEARKHWLTVEWLPKYAPELNDIEVVWHDLKAHQLAHQTFTDAEALDRGIHVGVAALNMERNVDSLVKWRISA